MADNQLHQLLAVEQDRRKKAGKIMRETMVTFIKKQDLFDGLTKVYKNLNEDDVELPAEHKPMETTVAKKINYARKAIITGIDAQVSKEETNNSGAAKAALKVGDTEFGELSATSLLALDQQLSDLRKMYDAIPTLDHARVWTPDEKEEGGVYKAAPEVKARTSKLQEPLVLHPPTKEFPAQTQLVTRDVTVGTNETTYVSGKLSSGDKSELLGRIDAIIDAVKRARARANKAEVKNTKIGEQIFAYVNKDIL